MTTTFTRTREQLRTLVLGKLGVYSVGETISSDDSNLVYEAIDLRLKEMHRLGVFWRKVTSVPVTFSLSASIATASAGAGEVLFPIRLTYTNGSQDDPIRIIGKDEYADIPDKTRGGNPEVAMWKGGSEFIFYPVPTADGTGKLLYEKIADDTAASTAPDVEVSMMRWLKDIVAYDLGDHFGLPEARMVRLEREAKAAELNIRKLAVERTDYTPVAVDDWTGIRNSRETDYGFMR